MADGIQVNDTGIRVKDTGIVIGAATDPCCCAASPVPCSDCDTFAGSATISGGSGACDTACTAALQGFSTPQAGFCQWVFHGSSSAGFVDLFLGYCTVAAKWI